jgi:hypothetical protein
MYRPLAHSIAALLDQAAPLDALCAEAANGLVPARPEAIAAILSDTAAASQAALPMLIALLLIRLPGAAAAMPRTAAGLKYVAIPAATDHAIDRLLLQLGMEDGTAVRLATSALADAGAAAGRIRALLDDVGGARGKPHRREQIRIIRQRLDASCKARFTLGMEQELLAPLHQLGTAPDLRAVRALETAARGLRILEQEARIVGGGATYDVLLRQAVEAVMDSTMQDRLTRVDQIRLVEVLAGPEAALAMLDGA